MNFNIAFNTIIYIMVFLFPGVLFRRAFFSGKFNKHFDSGNVFERLLWALLCSLISISLFSGLLLVIDHFTKGSVENFINIGYCDIIDNFRSIYGNVFPNIFDTPNSVIRIAELLFALYLFSALSGKLLHQIVFTLGLEKRFSLFKFQNAWDYLTNSNRQNNVSHKLGDIYYTKVDIKTTNDELFTGKLHDIVLDKDGKIDAIAIQDTYKFYQLNTSVDDAKIAHIEKLISEKDPNVIPHSVTSTDYIYRKRIKGNIFTIFNDNINNISITYVKVSHIYERFRKYLRYFVSTILALTVIFAITYGIWDYHILDFKTRLRRIGFCIILPFNVVTLLLLFFSLFKSVNKEFYWNNLLYSFLVVILFAVPYIYVLGITSFFYMTLISVIYLIIFSVIVYYLPNQTKNQKK